MIAPLQDTYLLDLDNVSREELESRVRNAVDLISAMAYHIQDLRIRNSVLSMNSGSSRISAYRKFVALLDIPVEHHASIESHLESIEGLNASVVAELVRIIRFGNSFGSDFDISMTLSGHSYDNLLSRAINGNLGNQDDYFSDEEEEWNNDEEDDDTDDEDEEDDILPHPFGF